MIIKSAHDWWINTNCDWDSYNILLFIQVLWVGMRHNFDMKMYKNICICIYIYIHICVCFYISRRLIHFFFKLTVSRECSQIFDGPCNNRCVSQYMGAPYGLMRTCRDYNKLSEVLCVIEHDTQYFNPCSIYLHCGFFFTYQRYTLNDFVESVL